MASIPAEAPALRPITDPLYRRTGDDVLAGLGKYRGLEEFREEVQRSGLIAALKIYQQDPDHSAVLDQILQDQLAEEDVPHMRKARQLWGEYGTEIGSALLLAALPEAFAAEAGALVLRASTQLLEQTRRRIRGTAQFLVLVLGGVAEGPLDQGNEKQKLGWTTDGQPLLAVVALRLYHESIRAFVGRRIAEYRDEVRSAAPSDGFHPPEEALARLAETPINQQDLVATLLSFTVVVFEVLEKFGIVWSADDQLSYLRAWNTIGKTLGIAPGLLPETVLEARTMATDLRTILWKSMDDEQSSSKRWWDGTRSGRLLTGALLAELQRAVPHWMRSWPAAVMRQLIPGQAVDRDFLGAGGAVLTTLTRIPGRHVVTDRFTGMRLPNRAGAGALRFMASQITRHVLIDFIEHRNPDEAPFVFPGIDEGWLARGRR